DKPWRRRCYERSADLRQSRRRSVDRGPAGVDQHRAAADVAAGVRRQKSDRAADFWRLSPTPDDGVSRVGVVDVGTRLDWGGERSLDDRRRDRVDSNAVAADLGGKAFHEQRNRGLGRTVDGKARLDGEGAYR